MFSHAYGNLQSFNNFILRLEKTFDESVRIGYSYHQTDIGLGPRPLQNAGDGAPGIVGDVVGLQFDPQTNRYIRSGS